METTFEEARMLLKGRDRQMREEWERTRWLGFIIVSGNPYIRQGHRPRKPSDLMRFPWEDAAPETKAYRPITEKEITGLNMIREVFYRRKHGKDR